MLTIPYLSTLPLDHGWDHDKYHSTRTPIEMAPHNQPAGDSGHGSVNNNNGPPPGWPFNLPSREALDYLEQALTTDRRRPAWDGSDVVVLDDQGRYVWSWGIDTPHGRVVTGSRVHEVLLPDGSRGRGLLYAHSRRQQRVAASRLPCARCRPFASELPDGVATPSPHTPVGSSAPSAQQASHIL